MGSDASARFGPSPLQVVRFLPLLLASSWLWLDALACTLSFYLTSLGSQCFLVLVGLCPLSCVQCSLFLLVHSCFTTYFLSLVADLFAFFIYFAGIGSFAFAFAPLLA